MLGGKYTYSWYPPFNKSAPDVCITIILVLEGEVPHILFLFTFFQFFDETMADGMKTHDVDNSEPTQVFIRRIRRLINAMSSRTPAGALRGDGTESAERKVKLFLTDCTLLTLKNGERIS